MNPKITSEHQERGAVVYARQSSMRQVLEHTESQRRQYALADTARSMGTWEEYERNTSMLKENGHRIRSTERKSARGGRALLTGLVRCGRCGRMMRVAYGVMAGHAHRYFCRGGARTEGDRCIGVRIDRAVSAQLVDALAPHAIDAALEAADRAGRADDDVRLALGHQLEEAKYEATLAARRHQAVDPDKRLVARELEARWEAALEHVAQLEKRIADLEPKPASPAIDRGALLALAHDLRAVWNAPDANPRTKQRLVRILVREVVLDVDDASKNVSTTIHWAGGRHTQVSVPRTRIRRYEDHERPSAVEVMRKIGGQSSDRTRRWGLPARAAIAQSTTMPQSTHSAPELTHPRLARSQELPPAREHSPHRWRFVTDRTKRAPAASPSPSELPHAISKLVSRTRNPRLKSNVGGALYDAGKVNPSPVGVIGPITKSKRLASLASITTTSGAPATLPRISG
jgi:hypothetical protein